MILKFGIYLQVWRSYQEM